MQILSNFPAPPVSFLQDANNKFPGASASATYTSAAEVRKEEAKRISDDIASKYGGSQIDIPKIVKWVREKMEQAGVEKQPENIGGPESGPNGPSVRSTYNAETIAKILSDPISTLFAATSS